MAAGKKKPLRHIVEAAIPKEDGGDKPPETVIFPADLCLFQHCDIKVSLRKINVSII
jgi:hypothetical protein